MTDYPKLASEVRAAAQSAAWHYFLQENALPQDDQFTLVSHDAALADLDGKVGEMTAGHQVVALVTVMRQIGRETFVSSLDQITTWSGTGQ